MLMEEFAPSARSATVHTPSTLLDSAINPAAMLSVHALPRNGCSVA